MTAATIRRAWLHQPYGKPRPVSILGPWGPSYVSVQLADKPQTPRHRLVVKPDELDLTEPPVSGRGKETR